jgi:hypothetical protein
VTFNLLFLTCCLKIVFAVISAEKDPRLLGNTRLDLMWINFGLLIVLFSGRLKDVRIKAHLPVTFASLLPTLLQSES